MVYTDDDHERRKVDVMRGVKYDVLNNIDVFYKVCYLIFGFFSFIRMKLSNQPYFYNHFSLVGNLAGEILIWPEKTPSFGRSA